MACLEIARQEQAKINVAFEINLAAFQRVEETLAAAKKRSQHQAIDEFAGAFQFRRTGAHHYLSGEHLYVSPFG